MARFGVPAGLPMRARLSVVFVAVLAMVLSLTVVVPAQAAVTTPGGFTSLTASRLLDTRTGLGAPKAAVAPGGTVHLQVAGIGGVPGSGCRRWC